MKKLFLLLGATLLCISCIDNDYDLSNIDTDNTTIGGDESVFNMPLATVEVKMSELRAKNDTGIDIQVVFNEVDIWLPSLLPEGADYLDISRLTSDPVYTDALLTALLKQMEMDGQKMEQVADLIWTKYSTPFIALLFPTGGAPTQAEFMTAFKALFGQTALLRDEIKQVATTYLTDIDIDDIRYSIGKIDVGIDVIDMLAKNLDPAGTPNPKNTLHLYGEIYSMLPLSLALAPSFPPTSVHFDTFTIEPNATSKIPEAQLFEIDLRQILSGVDLLIPITLVRYYPAVGFNEQEVIRMSLCLKKCGGLKIDF
ncbi:MAG: hypothetical protein RSB23_05870 [Alistipes sp.]